MAKRKAEGLSDSLSVNGSKKVKHNDLSKAKKPSLLEDSDSSDSESGGAELNPEFNINEEYARRFEHNKKREELHRLEEKYSKKSKSGDDDEDDDEEDSSEDETEDDEGFLATEALDAEISATLEAIRKKDPRVYDTKTTFYTPIEEGAEDYLKEQKKEKPMHLRDYHRENLLKGNVGEEEEKQVPLTFAQEQEELKKTLVKEMHAAAEDDSASEDEDGGFLVPKSAPEKTGQGVHPSRKQNIKVDLDVANADKDPETFLSNFLSARAWVPLEGSRFQPLESDDDEEEERIEKFEAAYNLRFEDPKGSNEVLRTYARDVTAAKSVRREEASGRKKQREAAREKKEAEKREREEERARLRRLKIEEMEEKLKKIKKAAGLKGKALKDEDWTKFLENDWDDETWEKEMNRKFGEDYYAEEEEEEEGSGSENGSESASGEKANKKKKLKKPKWDDDIDIKDLIPEFEEEEEKQKRPAFTLSDEDDEEVDGEDDEEEDGDNEERKRPKSKKERQQEKAANKKAARLERKKIEEIVDSKMDLDLALNFGQSTFRYRETSPTSFGLTARDILMAPDTALNEFAGLKKMATFRDPEKKRKDKKKLGKKARLRQWRKETFGNEDGPEVVIGENAANDMDVDGALEAVQAKKKKKRSRKGKGKASDDV